MDLFSYPATPGFQARDASEAAARDMEPKAPAWRQRVIHALRDSTGLTADEIALQLGADVLTIRPRVTELVHAGEVEDTGKRRPGIRGKLMAVWRLV